MRLFIAEKPDLAKDIANSLTDGSYIKKNGYFECKNNDRVTWCYGHLLKSVEPEMYNPDYKRRWNPADLPLKLFPLRYEPIPDKKSHTDLVINLINQSDEIVHAGDPDDEGQLLVDELLIYANNRKPVKRILINDNNLNAVKKALNNLKDNRDFYGIYQKTYARSAGDLLYGLSMTRAYTLEAKAKGYQGVLSVGRVQTPILGLIVRRWQAFQAHETSFYYFLDGMFDIGGKSFSGRFKPTEDAPKDDKGRIINKDWLEKVGLRCNGQTATITASCVKEKETAPPPL